MTRARNLGQLAGTSYVSSTNNNVGIGSTIPLSRLTVDGDGRFSGVVTAIGGFNIGIQSAGTNITTGVVTAINFVGTGNSITYNSTTKTVSVSISGSGGSGVTELDITSSLFI